MSTHCQREFRVKNFGLHHKKPIIFVTPTFGPHILYPFWLCLQLIYHIVVLGLDGSEASDAPWEPTGHYFLYIHNWAYLLLVLSNIVDGIVTIYVHWLARHILQERDSTHAEAEIVMRNKAVKISYKTMGNYYKMRWYLMLPWVFYTLSTVTGMAVSISHWALYFTEPYLGYTLLGTFIEENGLDFGTLAFTFLNTLLILIHIFISAKPFRLLHFYMPMSVFLVYIIFSLIYQAISNNYIYAILDWNQVFITTGISAGVVFVYVPLIHLLVYGIVVGRTRLGEWCHIRYAFSRWKRNRVSHSVETSYSHSGSRKNQTSVHSVASTIPDKRSLELREKRQDTPNNITSFDTEGTHITESPTSLHFTRTYSDSEMPATSELNQ